MFALHCVVFLRLEVELMRSKCNICHERQVCAEKRPQLWSRLFSVFRTESLF